MALKLKTAPSVEPISLAEAKLHLRIDSEALADNITTEISIAPGDHVIAAAYSLQGSTVEVSGYDVLVNLESGANGSGGTVDVKLQESNDGSNWSDVSGGAFTQVTEANDNAVQEKAYTGAYTYIRAVATVAVATCDFGVTIVKKAGPAVEDDELDIIIATARQHAEDIMTRRAFITQVWELWLDNWPSKDYIELPRPPIQEPAVTAGSFVTGTVYRILTVGTTDFTAIGADSNTVGVIFTATGAGSGTGTATASGIVAYYDTDDTVYYMDGGDYFLDIKSEPGRIGLKHGKNWPSTTLRPHNGICITYTAGYGDASTDVPNKFRLGLLLLIGHFYEHREEVTTGTLTRVPMAAKSLLGGEKVY